MTVFVIRFLIAQLVYIRNIGQFVIVILLSEEIRYRVALVGFCVGLDVLVHLAVYLIRVPHLIDVDFGRFLEKSHLNWLQIELMLARGLRRLLIVDVLGFI